MEKIIYRCEIYLFKIGFNQLINKLSFMRNWCFVLAESIIEKQSLEEAFKESADYIKYLYVCDFLSLPKVFINPGCEISVHLINITSITASRNKFINNFWTENTWIRIFVRKSLT